MPKLSPEECLARFAVVERSLAAKPWFTGWRCDTHPFPSAQPDGITFQLDRPHWFNEPAAGREAHQGIHFESWLSFTQPAKSFVTLHLLHTPTLPGTDLKRKQLAEAVVDPLYAEISTWPGYSFRAGRYGQQPFVKALDGSAADFPAQLSQELERLCLHVAPTIEAALKQLLAPQQP